MEAVMLRSVCFVCLSFYTLDKPATHAAEYRGFDAHRCVLFTQLISSCCHDLLGLLRCVLCSAIYRQSKFNSQFDGNSIGTRVSQAAGPSGHDNADV